MVSTTFQSRLFNILILIASLCVVLLSAEIFLRIFMPVNYLKPRKPIPQDAWRELIHKPSDIPGLDYELRPNVEKFTKDALVRTNSYGMRDDELSIKRDNVFRIAVIGDSFTFGFGVENEETYPSVLEKLLNETGSNYKYEVLNFGVGGYSSKDEALVVRYKVMPRNPDLLIIGYVSNDPETDPIQPLHAYYHKPVWWQHSHLLRLIAKTKNNLDMEYYGGGDYVSYLHHYPPKWETVLDAFKNIRDAANSRNIKVVVAIFPCRREIYNKVKDVASGFGFIVVGMNESFSTYPLRELSLPDGHPNILGYQVAARAIRGALVNNQLLPR